MHIGYKLSKNLYSKFVEYTDMFLQHATCVRVLKDPDYYPLVIFIVQEGEIDTRGLIWVAPYFH